MKKINILSLLICILMLNGCTGEDLSYLKQVVEEGKHSTFEGYDLPIAPAEYIARAAQFRYEYFYSVDDVIVTSSEFVSAGNIIVRSKKMGYMLIDKIVGAIVANTTFTLYPKTSTQYSTTVAIRFPYVDSNGNIAYIEVKLEQGKNTVIPDLPEISNNISMIDLGLSVKWADRNLGAEDANSLGDTYQLTYGGKYAKTIDVMGTPYDPAYSLDETMRLPSYYEWNELGSQCEWEYEVNGANIGFRATGPNGNSIFFPMDFNDLSNTTFYYWTGKFASSYNYNSSYDYYYSYYIRYSSSSNKPNISSYSNNYSKDYRYVRPVQDK